jgi:NADH-quinone oxidoreductase subunit E
MTESTTPQFADATHTRVRELISRYPAEQKKSALIPLLHIAQEELGHGWLPVPVMDYVAQILNIQPIEVYEVASFYTMFHLEPVGRHVIEVCHTSPCCQLGAIELVDYLKDKLDIEVGGTTSDGMFTLRKVECLASCGTAPMMQVGEHYYENMTPEKCDELLRRLENVPFASKEKVM